MTTHCIIDIDTTIANNDHRANLLSRNCRLCDFKHPEEYKGVCKSCGYKELVIPQDLWDKFLDPEKLKQDIPVEHAREVLNLFRQHGFDITFLTGRNETLKAKTAEWLTEHMDFNSYAEDLIVRTDKHHHMAASVYKEDTFKEHFRHHIGKTNFLFFEDDPHVLHVWRKYGMVFQCPEAWASMNPHTIDGNEPALGR